MDLLLFIPYQTVDHDTAVWGYLFFLIMSLIDFIAWFAGLLTFSMDRNPILIAWVGNSYGRIVGMEFTGEGFSGV